MLLKQKPGHDKHNDVELFCINKLLRCTCDVVFTLSLGLVKIVHELIASGGEVTHPAVQTGVGHQ